MTELNKWHFKERQLQKKNWKNKNKKIKRGNSAIPHLELDYISLSLSSPKLTNSELQKVLAGLTVH